MIVTFYSFKGGVGRSMAMANVGEFLADMGYRVILSDWDLEAPGLERYLWPHDSDSRKVPYKQEDDPLLATPGLIELLEEYKQTLADPAEPDGEPSDDFAMVGTVRLRRPWSQTVEVSKQIVRPGWLRLLTAGQRNGEFLQRYAESIRRFDWKEFYDRWAGDSYMEFFRRDLVGDPLNDARGAADILLIDSRTGVTEHGGVGTHHLADVVVVLTAANDLNMDGTRWMVDALRDPRLAKLRGGRALQVIPVASRIEQTSQRDELLDFRRRFLAAFKDTLDKSVGDAETFAVDSEIKYMPFYSFYERVVAREPEEDREPALAKAYRTLADGIVRCGVASGLLREPTSQGIVARAPASSAAVESEAAEWNDKKFLVDLNAALDTLDKAAAADLVDDFEEHLRNTDEMYSVADSITILRQLRRKCYFDLAQRVAETLIEYGLNVPRVRLLYAQSLIELGNLAAARNTLQALIADTKPDSVEQAEARGQLATVFERKYLDAPDPSSARSRKNLERAVNTYYEVYQSNPSGFTWHGIRTVALVQRARRDGIELEAAPDAQSLARTIKELLESHTLRTDWMIGIVIEAALALKDHMAALTWLQRYLASPVNDAYQLILLHRVLTDIWLLELESEPGGSLLPPLRAAILQRGGRLDVDVAEAPRIREASAAQLHSVLDDEGFRSVLWYGMALERCQAVARIDSRTGGAVSTGFVLPGTSLHASLGDDLVLLTSARAVSDDPASRSSLRAYEAVAVFETLSESVGLKDIVISSPQLDATIVRLDRRIVGIPSYPIAQPLTSIERVLLIGYFAEEQLSMSASVVLDSEDPLMHYRAAMEAVGGGSPIFDSKWQLLGIHHTSGANMRRLHGQPGTYAASEGISIDAIIRWLNAVLGPPRAKTRATKTPARKKAVKRTRAKTRQ